MNAIPLNEIPLNGKVKELNIKNQTYYFFDDMIDIKNFQSDLKKNI